MRLLEFRSVSKSFGALQVLKGVDLIVAPGERHALIGPNGAGKSTLFNIASGRLQPNQGHVLFKGRDISREPVHKRANDGIGRSFQIINVFPKLTVEENVRCAVAAKLGYRLSIVRLFDRIRAVSARAVELLDAVGLADRTDTVAATLAYGEQRRLELALAAAADPEVYLLDEPCAGLNADDTWAAIELIQKVVADRALLIVEHDMDVVFKIADRISVLHQGKVLVTGSAEDVRTSTVVKEAYLGSHADAP